MSPSDFDRKIQLEAARKMRDNARAMRIDNFDGGTTTYVHVREGVAWARSKHPDELVTLDFDTHGNLIGVEVLCPQSEKSEKAEE